MRGTRWGSTVAKSQRVSDQLRSAIVAHGSSAALAEKAGVHRAALSRFLRRKSGVTVSTVESLCKVLGLQLAPIEPRAKPRRRLRPVEAQQSNGQAAAQVERLGIYWRQGRPFLHLRVKGRVVAIEEGQQAPRYTDAGLTFVGSRFPGLEPITLDLAGSGEVVPLQGFTADPSVSRFYREFLGYCGDPSKWPPESERGVEVETVWAGDGETRGE